MALPDTQVTSLYLQGSSCAEIAGLDGCSETAMYNRLQSLGVEMRSRSEANKLFPDPVFVALYNLGLSSSQIGRLLGVDASTVTKRLHTIGFPLRSRRDASRIRYTEEEFKQHFMHKDAIDELMALMETLNQK